jgi:hypothetical protein
MFEIQTDCKTNLNLLILTFEHAWSLFSGGSIDDHIAPELELFFTRLLKMSQLLAHCFRIGIILLNNKLNFKRNAMCSSCVLLVSFQL